MLVDIFYTYRLQMILLQLVLLHLRKQEPSQHHLPPEQNAHSRDATSLLNILPLHLNSIHLLFHQLHVL